MQGNPGVEDLFKSLAATEAFQRAFRDRREAVGGILKSSKEEWRKILAEAGGIQLPPTPVATGDQTPEDKQLDRIEVWIQAEAERLRGGIEQIQRVTGVVAAVTAGAGGGEAPPRAAFRKKGFAS